MSTPAPPAPDVRAIASENPDPGREPLRALLDALRYPLAESALLSNFVLLLSHGAAALLPVFSLPVHLLVWLGLYKYALEVLATSAEGRTRPPDGWSAVDPAVHWDHHGLQLVVLLLWLAATYLASGATQLVLLAALALVLPGMVLALAIAQNLWTALNPLAWARIGAQLGLGYGWLAALAWPLLCLQARGDALIAASGWGWLGSLVYYLLAQHLVLAFFRLLGLAAFAHAERFGIQRLDRSRPVLARDKQQAYQDQAAREALQTADPAERAAQMETQLALGAPDALHREYRSCLRTLGNRSGLGEHARRRVCELLNLQQPRQAVALANEALADEPGFCPPDAVHTQALALAAERMTLVRQSAQLLANYRAAYPRRYDGLPLAMLAARHYADLLGEREQAMKLLRGAQPLTAAGEQSAAFARAIERLQRGLPLTEPTAKN